MGTMLKAEASGGLLAAFDITGVSDMIRHTLRVVIPAFALILVYALPVQADYEAGKRAWDEMRPAEALKQWRAAADGGEGRAMLALGRLYMRGLGAPQDYIEAYVWFNLGAARGDLEAAKERDALAEKMTPKQIAAAQERARSWRPGAEERRTDDSVWEAKGSVGGDGAHESPKGKSEWAEPEDGLKDYEKALAHAVGENPKATGSGDYLAVLRDLEKKEKEAREAAERKAAEKKKAREAAERKAAEEKKAREAAERKAAEKKKAREAAERKAAEEKKAREAAERKAAEEKKAREAAERKAAEKKARCLGRSEGRSLCWIETSNQPGCYILIRYYDPDNDEGGISWSGPCRDGKAIGYGTMRVRNGGAYSGRLNNGGKREGVWKFRIGDAERSYINWGWSHFYYNTWEGEYQNDKKHGHWTFRDNNGGSVSGEYYNGKKYSLWEVTRYTGYGDIDVRGMGEYSKNGRKIGKWWMYHYNDGKLWSCVKGNCYNGRCTTRSGC